MTVSIDRAHALADLLRRANSGDGAAYRLFLDQLVPQIRKLAQRALNRIGTPSADLEDVVQEALLAVHLKRQTWDSDLPITPWLNAIVRYKLIDFARRNGRRREVDLDQDMDFAVPATEEADIPERDLARILNALSDTQRKIVTSISLKGIAIKDVAKEMNMSEVNVRVTLHRSLKALAAAYRSLSQ